jgi:hypothetical protein
MEEACPSMTNIDMTGLFEAMVTRDDVLSAKIAAESAFSSPAHQPALERGRPAPGRSGAYVVGTERSRQTGDRS